MSQKLFIFVILSIIILVLSNRLLAQEKEGEIIIFSERVGEVIDQEERNRYGLFSLIKGFQSAVLFKYDDGTYSFKIVYLDEASGEERIQWISRTEPEIIKIREFIDNFEQKQEEEPQVEKQQSSRIPPKPLRGRRTFLLTELGVNYRLTSPSQ